MSIRFKVILPYLLLTLVVAVIGVYVVTRLVTNSLNERLTNQLLEAGRVVSDSMARQEIKHLELARIIGFTRGLAEALNNGDRETVGALAEPIAAGLDAEVLVLIDAQGDELLTLIQQADGTFQTIGQPTGMGEMPIVQELIRSGDIQSLPGRSLNQNPVDQRYYYLSAIPVGLDDTMAGVIVVGTSLDSLLPYLKTTSLADIIFYGESGQILSTTLDLEGEPDALPEELTLTSAEYEQIFDSNDTISGGNFDLASRSYSLARSVLQVGSDGLCVFAVALPLNFVIETAATSRNTYSLIFLGAMLGVVFLGGIIARLITHPISQLVYTSKAITDGDLSQRTGIRSGDEIGTLAENFDHMTESLQQRTVELEKTYHILEQLDRTKTSFIQVSGHELRTPLTLINGYAQMIKQKSQDDPTTDSLAQGILNGTQRMLEVVNSMLDLSKIDSQTMEVVPEPVALSELVQKVRHEYLPALQQRNLNLNVEGLDSLPEIDADPTLLQKVFNQVIGNAIKYTPDGGVITVSGRTTGDSADGQGVEVCVKDSGIGIDPQHLELIFEKFYQTGEVLLHSSSRTSFKGGGPGLGLAIAKGIVLAHHGRIWAESVGHDEETCPGSRIYIQLPLKQEVT